MSYKINYPDLLHGNFNTLTSSKDTPATRQIISGRRGKSFSMMKTNEMKSEWSILDPIWLVKITVGLKYYGNIIDQTVYFRCKMSYNFLMKWLWYFEYLQARIKVKHPRRVVSLIVGRMNPQILLGKDFIEQRRVTLLKSRQRKIDKLINTPIDDDLFHYTSQGILDQINKLKSEIKSLEDGEIIFPVIPDYVNNIKHWL